MDINSKIDALSISRAKMRITDFQKKKIQQEKITMLTCYDYPSARILADSGVECVLVGDSVAMAVHGLKNTLMATMPMMIMHTEAVARGVHQQLLITDLPFLCHKISKSDTVNNARLLLQAGAQALKIEGGDNDTCATIEYLVNAGIPILGHIGLTPQYIYQLGGYKIQGKTHDQADELLAQAKRLENSGCQAIILECIPELVGQVITESLSIPTIGIGAGRYTDGQVLVWHDLLGMQDEFKPKFIKQYACIKPIVLEAINHYVTQVKNVEFPGVEHIFSNN